MMGAAAVLERRTHSLEPAQGGGDGLSVPLTEQIVLSELKRSIREALDAHPGFNARHFSIESPRIARIIDSGYREQLVTEAERSAVQLYFAELTYEISPDSAAQLARESAIGAAIQRRCKLAEVWQRCENIDVLSFMGTANSDLVDPNLARTGGNRGKEVLYHFINRLGEAAVEAGISGLNGGSSTGIMGAQSFSWERGILSSSLPPSADSAKIIAIPLKFHKDHREIPTDKASNGYMTPAMSTFLGRTPALLAFGKQYPIEDARQRVMIINIGGLGTLEEVSRVLSEIKLQGQVTGVFSGSRVKPPLVVLVSPEIVPGSPFWDGQVALFDMMRRTGAWRGQMEENLVVAELKDEADADRLVENIIAHYGRANELKGDSSPPSELAGLTDNELGTLKELDRALSGDVQFSGRFFDDRYPPYLRVLDAQYMEEVRIQAERYLLRRMNQLEGDGASEVDALLGALDDAKHIAIGWRQELRQLVMECVGTKTLTIIGSGNNGVWNNELEKVTFELMAEAVERGYTVVVGG